MNMIAALIATLLIGATIARGQSNTVTTPPCNDPACQGAKFLYFFCEPHTGAFIKKCSADPNNEPGLRMYKKSTPLVFCTNFNGAQWDRIRIQEPSDPLGTHQTEVFVLGNLEQRIREAERRWGLLCPPQGPNVEYPSCCVQIMFSTNLTDIGDARDAEAVTWTWPRNGSPLDPHTCEYDCQTSRIVINQQQQHVRPDKYGAPTHFIYTEEQNISSLPRTIDGIEYIYSNAYSVFLHEFGHWFGFGHDDDHGAPCQSHFGSIMHTGTAQDWDRIRRDLSNDDICMFKKAYCCEQTKSTSGVDQDAAIASSDMFHVIPNPPNDNVMRLDILQPISDRSARLRMVDISGVVVLERSIAKESRHLDIDISSLANGVYMLEILHGDNVTAEKVLIYR